LKVLMDARVLGAGLGPRHARTGIFRITSRVARELLRRPDVDLCFTSTGHVDHVVAARAFLADWPEAAGRFQGDGWLRYARGLRAQRLGALERIPLAGKTWRALQPALTLTRRKPDPTDVYFSPYSALPSGRRVDARARVIVLHDVIPMLRPDLFVPRSADGFAKILGSIEPTDWVVAVSETSRQDYLGMQDHDPERVVVVPNSVEERFKAAVPRERTLAVADRYGVGRAPYALCVATREPRKNLPHLVRAFAAATSRGLPTDLRLVLAGPPGWLQQELHAAHASSTVRERIVLPGWVDDEDLPALYAGARLFVYPSQYEGFGLPVLEAMSMGVPVVASSAGALPEVVGDAAVLVDPDDERALRDALVTLANDAGGRARLVEKGRARARSYAWDASIDTLVATFRRALEAAR
jgi:glycosyltransferase involved in cell wall biosynthesis